MSIMECAHCGRLCEGRGMNTCGECGSMVCETCHNTAGCPEGPAPEEAQLN